MKLYRTVTVSALVWSSAVFAFDLPEAELDALVRSRLNHLAALGVRAQGDVIVILNDSFSKTIAEAYLKKSDPKLYAKLRFVDADPAGAPQQIFDQIQKSPGVQGKSVTLVNEGMQVNSSFGAYLKPKDAERVVQTIRESHLSKGFEQDLVRLRGTYEGAAEVLSKELVELSGRRPTSGSENEILDRVSRRITQDLEIRSPEGQGLWGPAKSRWDRITQNGSERPTLQQLNEWMNYLAETEERKGVKLDHPYRANSGHLTIENLKSLDDQIDLKIENQVKKQLISGKFDSHYQETRQAMIGVVESAKGAPLNQEKYNSYFQTLQKNAASGFVADANTHGLLNNQNIEAIRSSGISPRERARLESIAVVEGSSAEVKRSSGQSIPVEPAKPHSTSVHSAVAPPKPGPSAEALIDAAFSKYSTNLDSGADEIVKLLKQDGVVTPATTEKMGALLRAARSDPDSSHKFIQKMLDEVLSQPQWQKVDPETMTNMMFNLQEYAKKGGKDVGDVMRKALGVGGASDPSGIFSSIKEVSGKSCKVQVLAVKILEAVK